MNSEDLFLHNKFLLNIMISLLCRIVRIFWFENIKFQGILNDIISHLREDNIFSMIIPFILFSELISQFQSDLPPKSKLYRYISDFKDKALLTIYDNSTNFLINILKQNLKFEKIEYCVIFINELSKCISECMEYEEDLNIKDENYKKYEIKPIYVPNCKKRNKESPLDFDSLVMICRCLFETHSIISKLVKE